MTRKKRWKWPAEIYNPPANLAVAGFVGDFNIFDPATVKRLFGVGAQNTWAVRPEAIDISPAERTSSANGGAAETEVTVTAVQVLGAMVRHYTRAQDVTIKVDLLNKPDQRLFQIGEKARISIARNAIAEMNE